MEKEMNETKHKYTLDAVCPWCGYRYLDSQEFEDEEDNIECGHCMKNFSVYREIEVTYCTERCETDKYTDIKKITDKDRKDVLNFALQKSKEFHDEDF